MICYEIKDLTFTYPRGRKAVLENFSLSVSEGEFLALCGPSGCGKSTLLRRLKPGLEDPGQARGSIEFYGVPLESLGDTKRIGFVMQSPDSQLKYETVGEELLRYLEGESAYITAAETASFFGIQTWLDRNVKTLSGGQKQLVNLASVMAASPDVLILDEPTAMLDPIAASEFIAAAYKINRELGTTVIIVEHRLEEVLPLSTRVVIMDGGRLIAEGSPEKAGAELKEKGHGMFLAMPAAMRIYMSLENAEREGGAPVSVRDGRLWLEEFAASKGYDPVIPREKIKEGKTAVLLKNAWFRYEKNGRDILTGIDFTARYGEITAIVGGNGTGKSTTAGVIAGRLKPYRGKVVTDSENTAFLPQNPMKMLTGGTLGETLRAIDPDIDAAVAVCLLEDLLDRTPESLSGGEKQRAALACLMLKKAGIYLLDEPTKGLDSEFKLVFSGIVKDLAAKGAAVIIVSHDLDFCAEKADRCVMLFDGWAVSEGEAAEFFAGNSFYTTSASRIARRILPDAVTVNEVINAFSGE